MINRPYTHKKLILFLLLSACVVGANARITCTLTGTVKNRSESTTLYLAPMHTDWRVMDVIEIPIRDSAFHYTLTTEMPEVYTLVFEDEVNKGSWMPINFMAENGTVRFVLNPMDEAEQNIILGGRLNRRYLYLQEEPVKLYPEAWLDARYDSLREADAYYSDEMKQWLASFTPDMDGRQRDSLFRVQSKIQELTPEAQALSEERWDVIRRQKAWVLDQIMQAPDESGLAALYGFIYSEVNYSAKTGNMEKYRTVYAEKYQKQYAENPMAQKIDLLLASTAVKVGNRFVDFTAPDLTGRQQTLSELIGGKVAVIDLWASWCGPCMRISKSLIPVWEKYKDKGFVIVGVARERNDTKAMEKAIGRLGLPWLNLVELNDRENIWMRYGIDNGAGKVLLVDQAGKILAIGFTAEELEKQLEQLYE